MTLYDRANPKSQKKKLPFLLEMAVKGRQFVFSNQIIIHNHVFGQSSTVQHQSTGKRIHVAILTGNFFLLRKSDFLEPYRNRITDIVSCKRKDFRFFDENEIPIPYEHVGHIFATRVRLFVQFSKADLRGCGRMLFHEQHPQHHVLSCIVTELEL
jgi:hypothetical protein